MAHQPVAWIVRYQYITMVDTDLNGILTAVFPKDF